MCFIENKNIYPKRPSAYEFYALKIVDLLRKVLPRQVKNKNRINCMG